MPLRIGMVKRISPIATQPTNICPIKILGGCTMNIPTMMIPVRKAVEKYMNAQHSPSRLRISHPQNGHRAIRMFHPLKIFPFPQLGHCLRAPRRMTVWISFTEGVTCIGAAVSVTCSFRALLYSDQFDIKNKRFVWADDLSCSLFAVGQI